MSTVLPDEVLLAVYAGITEDPPWRSLIEHLGARTYSSLSWLFFHWATQEEYASLDIGDSSGLVESMRTRYFERFAKNHPIPYLHLEPGRIYRVEEFIPEISLRQGTYYEEILRPANIDHLIMVHVAEPSGFKIWLDLGRSQEHGPYTDEDCRFLMRLIPHLEIALALYATHRRTALQRDVYQDLVENLTIGVITVDHGGYIVNMNEAAERFVKIPGFLSVSNGRLRPRSHQGAADFDDALQQIIRRERKVAAITLKSLPAETSHLGLLIRPLGPYRNFGDGSLPSAVIYLSDAASCRVGPASLVAELFGLSPAEAALSVLIAKGMSLTAAAEQLHLTEGSARTYLKQVFTKIDVHRQSELVALILRSVAVLSSESL